MPNSPKFPAWFHVTAGKLNGREGPSTESKSKYLRPRGFNLYLRREVTNEGRTWYVSRYGTYYASEYLAPGKSPKPPKPTKVASPVPGRGVTTPWGKKPRNRTYWRARGHHTGDDYACPTGTKVIAVRSGRVYKLWDSVLGNVALLYADNGKTYWYCHLSAYLVANGARVSAGQAIGRAGCSGTGAMGPHLHLEMRTGHTRSWAGRDYKPKW